MTEQASTLDRFQSVFRDIFDNDEIVVTRELTAANVDEWDSLAHVQLIVAVESEFGIQFTGSEIEKLDSVGALLDLIEAKTIT